MKRYLNIFLLIVFFIPLRLHAQPGGGWISLKEYLAQDFKLVGNKKYEYKSEENIEYLTVKLIAYKSDSQKVNDPKSKINIKILDEEWGYDPRYERDVYPYISQKGSVSGEFNINFPELKLKGKDAQVYPDGWKKVEFFAPAIITGVKLQKGLQSDILNNIYILPCSYTYSELKANSTGPAIYRYLERIKRIDRNKYVEFDTTKDGIRTTSNLMDFKAEFPNGDILEAAPGYVMTKRINGGLLNFSDASYYLYHYLEPTFYADWESLSRVSSIPLYYFYLGTRDYGEIPLFKIGRYKIEKDGKHELSHYYVYITTPSTYEDKWQEFLAVPFIYTKVDGSKILLYPNEPVSKRDEIKYMIKDISKYEDGMAFNYNGAGYPIKNFRDKDGLIYYITPIGMYNGDPNDISQKEVHDSSYLKKNWEKRQNETRERDRKFEAEEDQKREELNKKYGKEWVDIAWKYEIAIGMPIALAKEKMTGFHLISEDQHNAYYRWDTYDGHRFLTVNKKTGEIISIGSFYEDPGTPIGTWK